MTTFELLTLLISSASILLSIVAIMFTKKDKPSFMPIDNTFTKYSNVSHITLKFKNSSDKVIHDTTIMINYFDNNSIEIPSRIIENKLYYPISNESEFNYKIESIDMAFFIRVRFKGRYHSYLPLRMSKFKQEIWYSLYPIFNSSSEIIDFNIYNAYQKEIEKIKIDYKKQLEQYDKRIDKKQWI